jgi:hypothetical protein
MVTKRSKSHILIRVLLKGLGEKNHKIFEDGSTSNLPSTEKSTSSALSKQNNSGISYIYPGPPTAATGASEKMFSGHPPPLQQGWIGKEKKEIKKSALYTRWPLDCLITADTRETVKHIHEILGSRASFWTARPR